MDREVLMGAFLPLLGFGLAILEAVAVYQGIKNGRRARLVRDTPAGPVNRLGPGPAKLIGQAMALHGTLTAPLSGKPCVYFRFRVEEKRSHSGPHGGGTYWKKVIDDARSLPCGLDDGSGIAAVHLDEAELVLNPDGALSSGFFKDAPPELERTLHDQYHRSTRGLIFNKTMRFIETLIEEGDNLVVVGTAQATPGGNYELVRGDSLLLVSDKDENALAASYRRSAAVAWTLAVLLLAGAGAAAAAFLL
jgi:hypothetical protein